MARLMVRYDWRPWEYVSSQGAMDAEILSIRDKFRTVLDNDGLHTNWLVSDVIKWSGASSYQGYAFIVKHMVASVASGPCWLIVLPGHNNSLPSRFHYVMGAANDGVLSPYFFSVSANTSGIGTSSGSVGMHYNPTGGTTTPYNGGWDANGELVGGDLSSPTFNPYSELPDFMPTQGIKGMASSAAGSNFNHPFVAIFDDELPFAAFYMQYALYNWLNQFWVMGEILSPYLDTDTSKSGSLIGHFSGSSSDWVTPFGAVAVSAFTPSGVVETYGLEYHALYTVDNTPLPNGEYAWDVVTVYNNTSVKGYLHSDVVRVMGRHNRDYMKLFDGGNFVKCHTTLVFPYVPGETLFPGG